MPFSQFLVLLAALGMPWLIDTSLWSLSLSSHGVASCVSVSPLLTGTPVTLDWTSGSSVVKNPSAK